MAHRVAQMDFGTAELPSAGDSIPPKCPGSKKSTPAALHPAAPGVSRVGSPLMPGFAVSCGTIRLILRRMVS